MKNNKGFSLMEALVAVFITFLLAVSVAGMLTAFGVHNRNNLLMTCLTEASASAIEACRGGNDISSVECAGYNINITINGNCNPTNGCSEITATASYGGRRAVLKDMVCDIR